MTIGIIVCIKLRTSKTLALQICKVYIQYIVYSKHHLVASLLVCVKSVLQ